MENLSKQRWLALWQRVGAWGDAEKVYADLVARYAEPHRVYHTLTHIEHCLDELDRVCHLAKNSAAIEMALWYHDAIYDTKAKNNEEKSAELVLGVVKNALLPDNFGQLVASLVLATKHVAVLDYPDAKIVSDIDLAILGQPEERFDEYELGIRKEYEWVSDKAFIAGRSAILKSFIERPIIYSTQFFRDKYETQARRNIARSMRR